MIFLIGKWSGKNPSQIITHTNTGQHWRTSSDYRSTRVWSGLSFPIEWSLLHCYMFLLYMISVFIFSSAKFKLSQNNPEQHSCTLSNLEKVKTEVFFLYCGVMDTKSWVCLEIWIWQLLKCCLSVVVSVPDVIRIQSWQVHKLYQYYVIWSHC